MAMPETASRTVRRLMMLSKEEEANLITEVSVLAEMDHPNIVRINDFYD